MSELEKLLEKNKKEILDVVSKELDLPKAFLKTIDDYHPKCEGEDIELLMEKESEKALESLTKEMIKSRIVTMPKIYVVSSVPISRESLFHGFIKMNPILPNQSSYCVVAYFEPHYKVLKRRKPMKMRKRRNRAWQSVEENL